MGEINFLWDWFDFGVGLRIYRNSGSVAKFWMSIDIQIAWLNIWIQLIPKFKAQDK